MAERREDLAVPQTGKVVKRRGLIAGAAALAVGIVAKRASKPVAAASQGTGSTVPLILQSNSLGSFDETTFPSTPNVASAATDLDASANFGNYVGYGAYVFRADARPSVSGNINGLEGYGRGTGVGVYGLSTSGVGVFGISNTSYGILGASSSAHGCTGSTSASGYAALIGQAAGNNTTALSGTVAPNVTGAYAAQLSGPVLVNGSFVVSGPKSAAAKHKDGTRRLLYCIEAPDSWFEDFGEATLVNGEAVVALDPEFAGVVDTSQYHVFLTEHDRHNDLHVTNRTARGFTVQADAQTLAAKGKKMADAAGTFSYRVVAKRGDIKTERLATFEMPTIKGVTIPPLPEGMPTKKG